MTPVLETKITKIRRAVQIGGLVLPVLAVLFVFAWFLYPNVASTPAPICNKGENGLWLRFHWYFGKKTERETRQVAALLRDKQIKFAYFHVLDVKPDGQLRYRKPDEAKRLIAAFRALAPDVKFVAWVSSGDWYPAHGTNLSTPKVRENMVASALWLTRECGFDGVQWDHEPCPNNSSDYIELLRATRKTLATDKFLSVATPMVYPDYSDSFGWKAPYFGRVAETCDQIAIMAYDSPSLTPWGYVQRVEQQVSIITRVIASSNPRCRLMMGVPAYDRNFLHDHNETLKLSLIGVRNGAANQQSDAAVLQGVAPFAEYTTDETEWKTYDKLWLGR